MIYFILGLMCILIGMQQLELYHSNSASNALIALGIIILLILGVKAIRYILTFSNEEANTAEDEKICTNEKHQ